MNLNVKLTAGCIAGVLLFAGCGTSTDNSTASSSTGTGSVTVDANSLVVGKINFYDYNNKAISVPYNTYVRIVPDSFVSQNIYDGVNCKVESDGSFGKDCRVDSGYEDEIQRALENNETFQFAIYAENGNDVYHWNSDEHAYFVDDNVTKNDIANFDLHIKRACIGEMFGYNWFKVLQKYAGDYRYEKSVVTLGNNQINLYTTKEDGNETRAAVNTYIYNGAGEIYTKVVLNEGGPYRKYKVVAATDISLDYNNSKVGYYAGLNIKPFYIGFWGGLYDYSGDFNEYNAGGCSLSSSVEGEVLKTYILNNNGVITYKVTDDGGNVLCQKDYNTSDLNFTGTVVLDYAKTAVQIDDDNAADNNDTAGSEVNATVLDFYAK
ncbi:hypothetical protein [Nautilia sp.]